MEAWHRFSLWGGNVFRDKAQALDDLLAAETRSIARGYVISLLIDCLVILGKDWILRTKLWLMVEKNSFWPVPY